MRPNKTTPRSEFTGDGVTSMNCTAVTLWHRRSVSVKTTTGKLVRDRIPDIIEAARGHADIRVLDDDAYDAALRAKLVEEVEEVEEFLAADGEHALEELADIIEVVAALTGRVGASWDELLAAVAAKRRHQGGVRPAVLAAPAVTSRFGGRDRPQPSAQGVRRSELDRGGSCGIHKSNSGALGHRSGHQSRGARKWTGRSGRRPLSASSISP